MKWYDCKPCRKLVCGESHPVICANLVGVCGSAGCYCEPGYVWHDKLKICVNEKECKRTVGQVAADVNNKTKHHSL